MIAFASPKEFTPFTGSVNSALAPPVEAAIVTPAPSSSALAPATFSRLPFAGVIVRPELLELCPAAMV